MESVVYQTSPAIINFAYSDYTALKEMDSGKIRTLATCMTCGITIRGVGSTTSNFLAHVKTHNGVYTNFLTEQHRKNPGRSIIFPRANKSIQREAPQLSSADPGRKNLSHSIAFNLILDSDAPLNIVEKEGFVRFLRELNPQITSVCGQAVMSHLSQEADEERASLIRELHGVDYISTTLNVWREHQVGWFIAATAHYITDDRLNSRLLDARRLTGSPLTSAIVETYKDIYTSYGIGVKMAAIVLDNVSDARVAANVKFPYFHDSDHELSSGLLNHNNMECWNYTELDTLQDFGQQRVGCFAHSLHLTAADGLKEVSIVGDVLQKVAKLSSLIHSSSTLQEVFESKLRSAEFLRSHETKWTSILRLLKAIFNKGFQPLTDLCDELNQAACKFTTLEWEQLKEFVNLLDLFGEAADLIESDKTVPISIVLPTVLSLYNHVTSHQFELLKPMAQALADSLACRFEGILYYCQMIDLSVEKAAVINDIYVVSTVLDPNYALLWLDVEVASQEIREKLIVDIKDKVCELAKALYPEIELKISSEDIQNDLDNLLGHNAPKKPRLGGYRQRQGNRSAASSIRSELEKYLHMPIEGETDPISFWSIHSPTMPGLSRLARYVLSTPATSAPVWRLISQGDIIPGAYQPPNNDVTLSDIIFLKCQRRFKDL